jgi:hypothetical protein
MEQVVWFLFGLGLGLALDWVLVKLMLKPLKKRLLALELSRGSGQDLPQHQNSYWKFEGPKLQKKVLDLEMELESIRSKTLWKQD